MKEVHIIVPAGEGYLLREALLKEFRYVDLVDGMTSDHLIITVSPAKVGSLLSYLQKMGVGLRYGTISVKDVSFRIPRLSARHREKGRISIEEMEVGMQANAELSLAFLVFVIASAVIASLGLIADNIVAVVASMIVAPFLSPVLAASFGIVLNDWTLLKKGLQTEVIGILLAIFIGLFVAIILGSDWLTHEMSIRTTVSLLDLVIAIVSGIAVGIASSEQQDVPVIGIAVAAALMPPAANTGILLYMQAWNLALGSFFLLFVNVLSIHLVSLLIFWIRGFKPTVAWRARARTIRLRQNLYYLVSVIFILVILVAGFFSISFNQIREQYQVRNVIQEEFTSENMTILNPPMIFISDTHIKVSLTLQYVGTDVRVIQQRIASADDRITKITGKSTTIEVFVIFVSKMQSTT